ncbi:hypothetical protein RCH14_000970 [Massilia sp. MP_M2]|uniref:hypothetical protein n=1 Tax=Massilia sp. MP_M2 TaxID=3071713 RepID=UPI00319D95FE
MKPLRVFFDVEFTNFESPDLISIGLVAETGEEAYFETDFDLHRCSDFVRHTVIPLVGKDVHALIDRDTLPLTIISWLKIVKAKDQIIELCADHNTDIILFKKVMKNIPTWIDLRNIEYRISLLLHENFFREQGLPEHHALYDARANAYAFRESTD